MPKGLAPPLLRAEEYGGVGVKPCRHGRALLSPKPPRRRKVLLPVRAPHRRVRLLPPLERKRHLTRHRGRRRAASAPPPRARLRRRRRPALVVVTASAAAAVLRGVTRRGRVLLSRPPVEDVLHVATARVAHGAARLRRAADGGVLVVGLRSLRARGRVPRVLRHGSPPPRRLRRRGAALPFAVEPQLARRHVRPRRRLAERRLLLQQLVDGPRRVAAEADVRTRRVLARHHRAHPFAVLRRRHRRHAPPPRAALPLRRLRGRLRQLPPPRTRRRRRRRGLRRGIVAVAPVERVEHLRRRGAHGLAARRLAAAAPPRRRALGGVARVVLRPGHLAAPARRRALRRGVARVVFVVVAALAEGVEGAGGGVVPVPVPDGRGAAAFDGGARRHGHGQDDAAAGGLHEGAEHADARHLLAVDAEHAHAERDAGVPGGTAAQEACHDHAAHLHAKRLVAHAVHGDVLLLRVQHGGLAGHRGTRG
eukprot:Rhum_TRINITY_DN7777_c0_g1::Rhum_TRINITY_DN7777_c0_g1_i1::g.24301::m.24301